MVGGSQACTARIGVITAGYRLRAFDYFARIEDALRSSLLVFVRKARQTYGAACGGEDLYYMLKTCLATPSAVVRAIVSFGPCSKLEHSRDLHEEACNILIRASASTLAVRNECAHKEWHTTQTYPSMSALEVLLCHCRSLAWMLAAHAPSGRVFARNLERLHQQLLRQYGIKDDPEPPVVSPQVSNGYTASDGLAECDDVGGLSCSGAGCDQAAIKRSEAHGRSVPG